MAAEICDGVLEDFLALHAQMAGRLGQGRAAVDIEQVMQPAVREQLGVEDAAVGIGPLPLARLHHEGAGAVAEQDAGRAVGPVEQLRHRLGADQKDGLGLPALMKLSATAIP